MALHPQVQEFLRQVDTIRPKRIEDSTPTEIRENMRAGMAREAAPAPLTSVEDRQIPGPESPLLLRIYRGSPHGSLPTLVFYHGGGWVAGDLDTHDVFCRAVAATAQALVVSVDYRLAPEHPFPAAAEDAYRALEWTYSHAPSLGGDPERMAVAGDSAGGNLATVVPLMARDRQGPALRRQILIYPITDSAMETESYAQFAEGHLLTRTAMEWFWRQYVPSPGDRMHPYVAPLRAERLDLLPPALVITAECDVLRDEGEAYAKRLQAAGVPARVTRYDGMIHGFVHRTTLFDAARQVVEQIGGELHALR